MNNDVKTELLKRSASKISTKNEKKGEKIMTKEVAASGKVRNLSKKWLGFLFCLN